jgi:hypothetical protein
MAQSTVRVEAFYPVPFETMREFRRLGHIFLREHAVSMCHDLISASYPVAAGSYDKAVKNQTKTVNSAFKSIRARTLANWLFDKDYQTAEAYKFKGFSPIINQLYNQKDWVQLEALFRGSPHNIQADGLAPVEVADTADLELLYKWKSLKGRKKKPIYIRNWKSINTVRNNKSIFSRVGLMAGGWLKAAKMLGNKPRAGTAKVWNDIWLQKNGVGSAFITENEGEITYTYYNEYANIGGYMNQPAAKKALKARYALCDAEFPLLWDQTMKNTGYTPN